MFVSPTFQDIFSVPIVQEDVTRNGLVHLYRENFRPAAREHLEKITTTKTPYADYIYRIDMINRILKEISVSVLLAKNY